MIGTILLGGSLWSQGVTRDKSFMNILYSLVNLPVASQWREGQVFIGEGPAGRVIREVSNHLLGTSGAVLIPLRVRACPRVILTSSGVVGWLLVLLVIPTRSVVEVQGGIVRLGLMNNLGWNVLG